jgi:hypothetical protein
VCKKLSKGIFAMSNFELIRENDRLIVLRPTEQLLAAKSLEEIVDDIKAAIAPRCSQKFSAYMLTDGTIRIYHTSEQAVIKEVLDLREPAKAVQ